MKIYNKKTTNSCKTRLLGSDRNIIKAYLRDIFSKEIELEIGDVFCNRKMQRIATKNTECCHPIFSLFSRQCVC